MSSRRSSSLVLLVVLVLLVLLAVLGLLVLAPAGPALAHRDDYLNETFVFQTLEAHEFEPELWFDVRSRSGGESSRAAAAAFEYGITERFMVDAFLGWNDPPGAAVGFERGRAEARLRFGEEGDRPVDLAASFEVEYERDRAMGEGESEETWAATPRLVLSRDLGAEWNVTLNLDLGREMRIDRTDRWTPGYAVAARWPREALLRYGVEARQDFGDERTSLVMPQVWLSLPHDATFKLGGGFDPGNSRRTRFGRIIFEIEL